jgi:hypothetical protein
MIRKYLLPLLAITAITAPATAQPGRALPHILVYKTRANYTKQIAVELSKDKTSVSFYPAPSDAANNPSPQKLKNGYWLSKSGISTRTAFLSITIKDYSKLSAPPPRTELYEKIIDNSPLTELWDCGMQGSISEKELNKLIKKGRLPKRCTRIQ